MLALLAATALCAQNKTAWKMPRTADGHPDLQGIWSNATRTPVERPAEFAGKPTLTDAEAKAWGAEGTPGLGGTRRHLRGPSA
jgi:hypothetical protein